MYHDWEQRMNSYNALRRVVSVVETKNAQTEVPWDTSQTAGWDSDVSAVVRTAVWVGLIIVIVLTVTVYMRRSRANTK